MQPESFNRLCNLSKSDFDAFVSWLSKTTVSELSKARAPPRRSYAPEGGKPEATRQAFVRYFQRGLRADLLLDELLQILFFQPSSYTSVFARAGHPNSEAQATIQMIKGLRLDELGVPEDRIGA